MEQYKIIKFSKKESELWLNSQNSIPGMLPDVAVKTIQARLLHLIKQESVMSMSMIESIIDASLYIIAKLSTKSIDRKLLDYQLVTSQIPSLIKISKYGHNVLSDTDMTNLISSLMFLSNFSKEHIDHDMSTSTKDSIYIGNLTLLVQTLLSSND